MNVLKVKTVASCFLTAAVLAVACEDEPLGPPKPSVGGSGGGGTGGVGDFVENGGEGGILIDGEVPTCLSGEK